MPPLVTGSRVPPLKNDGFWPLFHVTPPSRKNATSTGNGPYIRSLTPKGRSSGNRNSMLPTNMRLPMSRSNVWHEPLDPHSEDENELTPYPRTNSGYPMKSGTSRSSSPPSP